MTIKNIIMKNEIPSDSAFNKRVSTAKPTCGVDFLTSAAALNNEISFENYKINN